MKLLIVALFIVLISCSQQTEISDETKQTSVTKTEEIKISTEEIITAQNITIDKNNVTKKLVNGIEYTIEVVDVTETADACLLKINGDLVIIDEGETKKINGLRIFVADVFALRNVEEDKDICQLVIA